MCASVDQEWRYGWEPFGFVGFLRQWGDFCFMRNLILKVILFSGFLVFIKFKLGKQILVLTVMLCSLLIQ